MMTKDIKICGLGPTGFWRCGVHFPPEGKFVARGDFSDTQWKILTDEKMVRISEATEAEIEAANPPNELHARIADVIQLLSPEDFGQDGKPKVDAIRDRLGDEFGKIRAADRDAAWDAIQANRTDADKGDD